MSKITINKLQLLLANIQFISDNKFCYSAKTKSISYNQKLLNTTTGQYALLHECGHAILNHHDYLSDFDLLKMEVLAWQVAQELANNFKMTINNNHIQDCLDSYRDWLHQRSICPNCHQNGYSTQKNRYNCLNCDYSWLLSDARFKRTYRHHLKSPNCSI